MEGQFDREKDDSGWGAEAPAWVDLETQLNNMQTLVRLSRGKEDSEKLKKKMDKKVREVMKEDGLKLTDRQNLGDWLRGKMNSARKEKDEAQGKLNEANVWSRGKHKTDKEKWE
ncbi:hypothetical protein XENORESO_013682 [Xenotaenia resolanae]|uniref:Uncharacterized protein n=1 Tax=Xenotaenia resolanae TaxID=208358 RepID=A0ABV0WK73_9TELE